MSFFSAGPALLLKEVFRESPVRYHFGRKQQTNEMILSRTETQQMVIDKYHMTFIITLDIDPLSEWTIFQHTGSQ
jgi:hypothetical protein